MHYIALTLFVLLLTYNLKLLIYSTVQISNASIKISVGNSMICSDI